MSGFWDDPQHWPEGQSWPATEGLAIEGVITRIEVLTSRYGRLQLCIELDGDGRKRWCNGRLWRAIAETRADLGDRIRVTRGADDRDGSPGSNGRLPSTWTVERLPMRPAPTVTSDQGSVARSSQGDVSRGPQW